MSERFVSFAPIDLWGDYSVGNDGTVRSNRDPRGWVIVPPFSKGGMLAVRIYPVFGDPIERYVHELVLESFNSPRPSPKHVGEHIDGNPMNNKSTNLRWTTVRKKDSSVEHSEQFVVVGIDPGQEGGVAAVSAKDGKLRFLGQLPCLNKEPDLARIKSILSSLKVTRVWIEQQKVFNKQGAVSAGSTMYGFGALVGLVAGMGISCEIVTPAQWRAGMAVNVTKKKGEKAYSHKRKLKATSIAKFKRMFPKADLKFSTHSRAADKDGPAEAALIAVYGQRVG